MRDCFKYLDAMVTPVPCFGAAHRKVYKQDLCRMDIVFRRLLRSIVGPPADVDWTLPWHETLHHWNERVQFFTARHGLKTWSVVCVGQYQKFANYVATVPRERWVVRELNEFPGQIFGFNTTLTSFLFASDDVIFSRCRVLFVHTMLLRFNSGALNGPPLGIQDQSQNQNLRTCSKSWPHCLQLGLSEVKPVCPQA